MTRLYVSPNSGGMFCLDGKTGKELWWAPRDPSLRGLRKNRVYGADAAGRRRSGSAGGGRLDVLPTELLTVKFPNTQTDRLYLANDTGLVQCLREIDLPKPIMYGEDRKMQKEEEPEKPAIKKPSDDADKPKDKPKPKPKPKNPGDQPEKKPPKDRPAKKAPVDKPPKVNKRLPPGQQPAAGNPLPGG